jgi:hypothetical protein
MENFGATIKAATNKPARIVRAWIEDWESEAIKKRDPVHEAKLLRKYGGLAWFDPDTKMMFTADSTRLYWQKKTKGQSSGYCIYGVREDYDPSDPDNEDTWEPWALQEGDCLLHELIVEWYKKNPQEGLQVIEKATEALSAEELAAARARGRATYEQLVPDDEISDDD